MSSRAAISHAARLVQNATASHLSSLGMNLSDVRPATGAVAVEDAAVGASVVSARAVLAVPTEADQFRQLARPSKCVLIVGVACGGAVAAIELVVHTRSTAAARPCPRSSTAWPCRDESPYHGLDGDPRLNPNVDSVDRNGRLPGGRHN